MIDALGLKIPKVGLEYRRDAASACWHAAQCIRNIHAQLGEIVDALWIERERFVVIRLSDSEKLQANGRIVVASGGSYAYCLRLPNSETTGHGEVGSGTMFFPTEGDMGTFERFGWPSKARGAPPQAK